MILRWLKCWFGRHEWARPVLVHMSLSRYGWWLYLCKHCKATRIQAQTKGDRDGDD